MKSSRNTFQSPRIYVRPVPLSDAEKEALSAQRRIVRQPEYDGQPMPDEGNWVDQNMFWIEMLKDGSVEKCSPPGGEAPAASPPPAAPPRRRAPAGAN